MGAINPLPINPNFPSSVKTGNIPVHPELMGQFRDWNEAYQAWRQSQLQGGNVPLSAFLANINPNAPGQNPGGGGGGPQYPPGSATSQSGTGSTSRSLPPAIQQAYADWLARVTGLSQKAGEAGGESRNLAIGSLMPLIEAPGYTPEERAQIEISPEEEATYISESGEPIQGAATRAQQNLLRYTNAAGYNPGLNASVERIQQEQARQASEAAIQARLGINAARRAGAAQIGEARMRQQREGAEGAAGLLRTDVTREGNLIGQGTNLLTNYPENRTETQNQEATRTGPPGTVPAPGALVGNLTAGLPMKPPWMNDRQWRDYQNRNPGTSGGSPPPLVGRKGFV